MTDIQRDKLLVVDLEATCWLGPPPEGQQNEIIEIGICVLDIETGEPALKRSLLIQPVRSKVSAFCTELTTLTQEQVDAGISLAEACAILENEYGSKAYGWGSWGNYDRRMFDEQCKVLGIPYPFTDVHINFKKVFAKVLRQKNTMGMVEAMAKLNLTPEGTHHRGDDDSWNTARIMGYLLKEHGRDILRRYW